MSRSNAAFDSAPANDWSINDRPASKETPSWAQDRNPTRRLPVHRVEEEARRLDKAALNASLRGDDEPTLDAPAPSSPAAIAAMLDPRPVRVTAHPPALKMLVITRPPPQTARASVAPAAAPGEPSQSGLRPKVTPELEPMTGRRGGAEDGRRSAATARRRRPTRGRQTYVVAGIWAMALLLVAVLMYVLISA